MKSTSSGSGLRRVLAMAWAPRSATSRRRISASTSWRSWVIRASYSSFRRRSSSAGQLAAAPGLVHQAGEHAIEIEVAQGPIQVVRATDGPSRLHPGVALDGLAGDGGQDGFVTVEEGLVQHVGQLLGREALHHPALLALALLLGPDLIHQIGQVGVGLADLELGGPATRSRPRRPFRRPSSGSSTSPRWRPGRT